MQINIVFEMNISIYNNNNNNDNMINCEVMKDMNV